VRRRRILTGAGVCFALAMLALATAPAAVSQSRPGKVLIVSMPRLAWRDVAEERPPALTAFLERSAYASLSVRTIGPLTDLGAGYITIGAGNRARADEQLAGQAYGADELVVQNTGAELYRAMTGKDPADAKVLALAITHARADADKLLYGSRPGALGQTVADAGKRTAVIANADGGPPAGTDRAHREAALAMMDEAGRVAGGVVDRSLTVVDPAAPGGRRTDPEAVLAAFDTAWASDDAVLVELSDLERAERNGVPVSGPERVPALAGGLEAADHLFARLVERVDLERDRVIVVSPAAPGDMGQLTVFAMAGPGVEPGQARSATTRRAGYVTLPDVGVTILDALGLDPPSSMNATAITSDGSRPFTPADASRLADADDLARFRDRTVGPVSVIYVALQVVTYGLAAAALLTRRERLGGGVRLAALTILAVPLVAFLSGLTRYHELPLAAYVGLVFGLALVIALVALPIRRIHAFVPALALVGANWLLQVVDVVAGGHLQLDTPFGYSPIVAGRFQGVGNLAFAILAATAVVVATGPPGLRRRTWQADAAVDEATPRPYIVWAIVVGMITLVADGYPAFGSDVGGVLALVPAFVVLVLLLGGWRVTWQKLAVAAAGALVALAALAAVDLSRPADDRTHLGRFATQLLDGDAEVVIRRKLQANWFILTSSIWTWLVPVALGFLTFLALRRTGFLHRLQRRVPGVRPCLFGALVVGVLGFALNDSGVAVPAMMFGVVLPWITWLLLTTEPVT
jgi:hypothetical protein